MTIIYPAGHSSTDWGVILSTTETAGAPSGSIIYLFTNKVVRPKISQDKTNLLSNRKAHRRARGKVKISVDLPSIFIPDRSIDSVNLISTYVDPLMAKNANPSFIWIRSKVAGVWKYMKFPSVTGTQVNYLMGYIEMWTDDISEFFMAKLKFGVAYTGG